MSKKALVVRKPDRTVHVVPLGNKSYLQAQNNRLPADKRLRFEEMDEEEALKLPFFDENYISPSAAQDKLKVVENDLLEKDTRIAELEAKLAEMEQRQAKGAENTQKQGGTITAVELIDQIGKEENVDVVKALLDGETRKTVIDAANKRISELESK